MLGTDKYKMQLNKQEDKHSPLEKKAFVEQWSIYLSVASQIFHLAFGGRDSLRYGEGKCARRCFGGCVGGRGARVRAKAGQR